MTALLLTGSAALLREARDEAYAVLGEVSGVRVETGSLTIDLAWTLPAGAVEVRVVRKAGAVPAHPKDGDRVEALRDRAHDRGLDDDRVYHYGLFAIYRLPDGRLVPSRGVFVSAQPHAPSFRYERISGFGNGFMSSLRVQVTGGFFDSGTLHSYGPSLTLSLGQGSQYLSLWFVPTTPHVNQATCRVTYHVDARMYVNGGTGQYFGYHGYGSASITETGAVPRVNGHCSSPFNIIPSTAHTTFVASAELSRF